MQQSSAITKPRNFFLKRSSETKPTIHSQASRAGWGAPFCWSRRNTLLLASCAEELPHKLRQHSSCVRRGESPTRSGGRRQGGMPSRSATLQPQGSGTTERHSSPVGAEECPAGQRHATQSECWAAVSASREEAPAMPAVKVVDTRLVPRGCSYSHASKMAVFNNNKAGGCPPKWDCFYDLVCVADDAEARP